MIKNIHLFNFHCTERLFNKVTKEDYIKKRMSESDQYSKGYVAFLDLMGFKEMCRNYPCQEIKSIINDIGLLEIDFREAKAIPLSEEIVKRTNIKLVSDSIIITTPNDDYGLLCIIYYCAFLHIRLLKYRTLLRGGIAFGEYYCDDNTVFGPALAEAHDIESNISVYPRVVVSDYIVAHLKETKCFEGNNAYGYVKDPENKKKWIIDPDAAEVVQRIFRLCIEGNGNETIARILQDDRVLVPQAYWQSKGMSRGGKKTQQNPYKWCKTTIAKMLEQQEYCGDIINFKSYSKSFRNKTRVENPKENWAIFKDVHEPIIDRETWERVQELTKNSKRRKPKNENVKKSIFTNLLYCGDCGHKLWFNINKQNPSIRFYSCSNYKGLRGTCESTHYVREDSLEQVVKMELFKLATYLDHDETAFAELLEHKTNKDALAERKAAESALAAATARSQELLRLYERVYEDNVNGKVTDDWFMRLSHKYEVEQEELKKQMFDLKNKIERLDTAQNSSGNFIRAIRKFMTMQTLTPIVLQELIDKIEVFPIEGTGKNRTQRLVIHYRFVGCIDLPSIVPKHTYKLDSRQGVAIEYLPSAV